MGVLRVCLKCAGIAQAAATTAELTATESSADWNNIADRWQRAIPLEGFAIASLGDIPINSDDYSQAQVKMVLSLTLKSEPTPVRQTLEAYAAEEFPGWTMRNWWTTADLFDENEPF